MSRYLFLGGLGLLFSLNSFAISNSFQTQLNRWVRKNHVSSSVVSIENTKIHQVQNFVSGSTDPQKLYGVGSISKTFVVATLLELQQENRINLDNPIGPYFPEYPRWGDITIRELLNMSSGIYNFTESSEFKILEQKHYREKISPQKLIKIAYRQQDYFAPSRGWHYSNTNYFLAGLIIEKVTHESLDHVYQRRFFQPLGLHHTYYSDYFYSKFVIQQMALALPNGVGTKNARTKFNAGFFGPAGGMVMSSQDLLLWIEDLFTEGKVLNAVSLAQLKTTLEFPYAAPRPKNAAYGLGIYSIPQNHDFIWWYTGVIDGYTSFFAWMPQQHSLIVAQAASWPGTNYAILFPNQFLIKNLIARIIWRESKQV